MEQNKDYCVKRCDLPDSENPNCPVTEESVDKIKGCPIDGPNSSLVVAKTYTFEIYYSDLTDEAKKQLDEITDGDHNYDIYPLAELVIERDVSCV